MIGTAGFEDGWKSGVLPVFRKSKEEDLGNYRLVSLVMIANKVIK